MTRSGLPFSRAPSFLHGRRGGFLTIAESAFVNGHIHHADVRSSFACKSRLCTASFMDSAWYARTNIEL